MRTRPRMSTTTDLARGVSVVELVIAMAVVGIALLSLASVLLSAMSLEQASREETLACNAARQVVEKIRSTPLSQA